IVSITLPSLPFWIPRTTPRLTVEAQAATKRVKAATTRAAKVEKVTMKHLAATKVRRVPPPRRLQLDRLRKSLIRCQKQSNFVPQFCHIVDVDQIKKQILHHVQSRHHQQLRS